MGLGSKQRLALKQQINIQQIINLETLLSMPPIAIDSIINSVVSNPEKTDKILKSKKEKYPSSKATGAIFSYLHDSKKSDKENIIIDLQLKDLGLLIKKEAIIQTSLDVEYKSVEKHKPRIKYSSHLIDKLDFEIQQISSQFKEAGSLYDFLIKQRNYIVFELREIYTRLGDEQREFIETLNPAYLHAFSENKLAKKMNLPETTIHELLKRKYVLIESLKGKKEIHPVDYLMPTPKDIERHNADSEINKILTKESATGINYSDSKILDKIKTIGRRTVTKYWKEFRILDLRGRKKIYAKNRLTQFQMPYFRN